MFNVLVSSGRKEKLQKRLKAVLLKDGNKVCADCGAKEVTVACILENPVDRPDFRLGFTSCAECASALHDLGSDVCYVKKTESSSNTECKL